MHEIRATMAAEHVAEATRLAHASGIERVAVSDVFIDGPNVRHKVVSVETSTPNARLFVEALLGSPLLSGAEYSLTSRELRAIVDGTGDQTYERAVSRRDTRPLAIEPCDSELCWTRGCGPHPSRHPHHRRQCYRDRCRGALLVHKFRNGPAATVASDALGHQVILNCCSRYRVKVPGCH